VAPGSCRRTSGTKQNWVLQDLTGGPMVVLGVQTGVGETVTHASTMYVTWVAATVGPERPWAPKSVWVQQDLTGGPGVFSGLSMGAGGTSWP